MDSLVDAIRAVNGPWPFAALALIGLYSLFWKFGKEILALAQKSHEKTEHIAQSIVTNHGSKNLGDAVDRLTEMQMVQTQMLAGLDNRLTKLEEKGDG